MSEKSFSPPTRLPGQVLERLNEGRFGNPDVLLVEGPDGPCVVKDYAPRSAWIRGTLGRIVTAHERAVYERLAQVPGAARWSPGFRGGIDGLAFVLEYRPGRILTRSLREELPTGFMSDLEKAVDELHAAGIVHLDLRHRSNILADATGHPVILDFASAIMVRPGGWVHRLLIESLGRVDRRALEKWRARLVRSAIRG